MQLTLLADVSPKFFGYTAALLLLLGIASSHSLAGTAPQMQVPQVQVRPPVVAVAPAPQIPVRSAPAAFAVPQQAPAPVGRYTPPPGPQPSAPAAAPRFTPTS